MIEFLPGNHAVQRVGEVAINALSAAQQNVIWRVFPNAGEFCRQVLSDTKSAITLPAELSDRPTTDVCDLPLSELNAFWLGILKNAGVGEAPALPMAATLAQRSQLVRAFDNPDAVLDWAKNKVIEIVASLPKEASDIEVGRNPGDVMDPFILAATQDLLYGGDLNDALGAFVSHKSLMILEGLMGHLHEEIVGRMRGNMRASEPRGENQELYDPNLNPFPGADVVQPPDSEGQPLRFHQVKSKTGTLNSSGGARLAEQMRQLRMRYRGAEVYSHSLVGNTLRGHRTMGTMRRSEPDLIVTVGQNAFKILTKSDNGAELLLSLYRDAFVLAAHETGYSIKSITVRVAKTFQEQAEAEGESFYELMLDKVTSGPLDQQDSRHWVGGRRRRRST